MCVCLGYPASAMIQAFYGTKIKIQIPGMDLNKSMGKRTENSGVEEHGSSVKKEFLYCVGQTAFVDFR
jgi:hypothetical protein